MTKKKVTGIRFEDEVREELEFLCSQTGLTMSALVNLLVRQEYDRYKSDPKIQLIHDQLVEVAEMFQQMQAELKSAQA